MVLLIDDDPSVHMLIDFHLEPVVDRVLHAEHPVSGLQRAVDEQPNVILLDVNMPHLDGFQVCRQLKELEATRDIPVLFLTVDSSVQNLARALDIGGTDYVVKPFEVTELQARVRAALRTHRLIEMLRTHAHVDALTGLKNRAALDEALVLAASDFGRTGRTFALLLLDVDHFKRFNDTYGHGVGDEVLRKLGQVVQARCRPIDFAARYGGEELLVILQGLNESQAEVAGQRLLEAVRALRIVTADGPVGVTCSGGLALVQPGLTVEEVLEQADEALYRAKGSGRDQLVKWSSLVADPLTR